MKVKQLLKHFFHGMSDIDSVQIIREHKLLVELSDEEMSVPYYGGYDNESICVFTIEDGILKLYLN